MKIKEITQKLTEGKINPLIKMTLDEVVVNQRITNNYQAFVIAKLLSLFKNYEYIDDKGVLFDPFVGTTKETIDYVKSLPSNNLLELISNIRKNMIDGDRSHLDYDWIKLYTSREAND